jgi:hypothetical protein
LSSTTFTSATTPTSPETEIVLGYGDAFPLLGIVMLVLLLNTTADAGAAVRPTNRAESSKTPVVAAIERLRSEDPRLPSIQCLPPKAGDPGSA